jgi:hypothetical protein
MYVIWNKKIWSSYNAGAGWRPYTGANAHTTHMHLSLSWAGAQKKTSYWTGAVSPVLRAPGAPAVPAKPAPPIEAPARDLFPADEHDGHGHSSWSDGQNTGRTPASPRPVYNPDNLPVLAVGEGGIDVLAGEGEQKTPFVLQGGRHYLLTVTGTYAYGAQQGAPMQADAECSRWPRDRKWHRSTQWEGSGSNGNLDLTIQGRATSWSPMVDDGSGCDTATHTYTTVVQPRFDGPLRFAVRDGSRTDNSGSLHVAIRPLEGAATND